MKAKDQRKHDALFEATLDLVYETGLAGLKIAHIVKRAGLGTGTFYVYFTSKEDLLHQLYRHVKEQSLRYLFQEADRALPFKLHFQHLLRRTIQYRIDFQTQAVFTEQFIRSPYYKDVPQERAEIYFRPFQELLDRGKAEQLFKDLDNRLIASILLGIIKTTTETYKRDDTPLDQEAKTQIVMACWDSIKQ